MRGNGVVDLRSDTTTRPSQGMRRAIATAEVGDDVFREDPKVNDLERRCAGLFGKEEALFTSSGTMSNQLAIRSQVGDGGEAIVESRYHIYYYESAPSTLLGGAVLHPVTTDDGVLRPEDLELAVAAKPRGDYYSTPRLVCLENSICALGGTVVPVDAMERVGQAARNLGLAVHLDGARLLNAAIASGVPPDEYAAHADTVSMCFAKGLGAPFGSVLAGPSSVLERARRFRKWYGGGLHQSGMMAAGASHALDHNVDRLAEDHANAKLLGKLLQECPTLDVDQDQIHTNMLLVGVRRTGMDEHQFATVAAAEGVLVMPWRRHVVRLVTHLHISDDDVRVAADRLGAAVDRAA